MKSTKILSIAGTLIVGALLVGACDGGEKRPFNYKKGVYLGKPHTPLSEETLNGLRARAVYQAGPSAGSGGGGVAPVRSQSASSDVRPPAGGAVDSTALRQRTGQQRQ